MNNAEIASRLATVREQGYPLTLTAADADAIVECIRRIMAAVPGDDQPFVRADYELATSAIDHPEPGEYGTSNKRVRSPYQKP